ncbi:putative LppA-like lipoprotein [Prauserella shujinwangii]|uniref:Putative LppA-like lipoprotein n=1 Tax=Prauserella shujinwangii TaxID=1453103 RepID=A0A2T0LVA7_9PSEU|nr:LppA family lipoprotein [Prauserella shujinwangii]PRX47756.1 putative LppA-like lipoprotein [Prauserella shujinwangii]
MTIRAAVTAVTCAAALLVSGCGPDQSKDGDVNAHFAELLRRPDIERVQADYLAMVERIQSGLVREIGIEPFPDDGDEPVSGSACPGEFSAVPEAEVRRYRFGASPTPIDDDTWPRALRLVGDLAAERGFDRQDVVVDRPGDHEVAFRDRYGAELIFGTAENTVVSLSTGCHLTREAHERGTPAPEEPLY